MIEDLKVEDDVASVVVGLPTRLEWQLPAGLQAGEIDWPRPHRMPVGPLVNYGFEDEVVLPVQLTAPAGATPGSTVTLRGKADFLVCADICIPESANLELRLPVTAGPAPASGTGSRFPYLLPPGPRWSPRPRRRSDRLSTSTRRPWSSSTPCQASGR